MEARLLFTMRILNASAVKEHALACAQAIRGGKFTRVSETFLNEIQMEVEALIRSFESKYPSKTHTNVPHTLQFSTGEFFDKLQPILDNAIARLIQRKVEQHPSVGSTLQGK